LKAIIGKKLIKSLEPGDTPYEVRDDRLKGFILRVQPTGAMSWIWEYARGKRITIGPAEVFTSAQARDEARKHLADAAQGKDLRVKTGFVWVWILARARAVPVREGRQ